jgi:hypothetical protein
MLDVTAWQTDDSHELIMRIGTIKDTVGKMKRYLRD